MALSRLQEVSWQKQNTDSLLINTQALHEIKKNHRCRGAAWFFLGLWPSDDGLTPSVSGPAHRDSNAAAIATWL